MPKIEPVEEHRDYISSAWEKIERDRKTGMFIDDERRILAANDEYMVMLAEKLNELIESHNSLLGE
jgi:hypothetical protein